MADNRPVVTDLRAAILRACDQLDAATVDLRAVAGIDRELTLEEIIEVCRLSSRLLLSAGRLDYDAEPEWRLRTPPRNQTEGGQ